jgi:hypothetical protein
MVSMYLFKLLHNWFQLSSTWAEFVIGLSVNSHYAAGIMLLADFKHLSVDFVITDMELTSRLLRDTVPPYWMNLNFSDFRSGHHNTYINMIYEIYHKLCWGFLRTECWRYFDLKGRNTDHGENSIMMNFITYILHWILLGWLNREWGGRDMWHAWGRGEVFTGFWLGGPKARDH